MKIKDYNDAIEFFRTNDYKAADGAWSEFYQSEVLEPRIMDQASIADDLEPGPLKDEMLKDFDPSQETYEEYLQRKRLGERPFNMSDGGRIPFKYAGPVTFENIIKPKKFEQGNRWKKLPKGTFTMRLYMGLDENGKRIEKTFTGTKKELKNIFDVHNRGRVKGELPTLKDSEVYQIRQGANKGKWAIKMPKEKIYSFYETETLAEQHKIDYLNDPANKPGGKRTRKKVKPPEGYVSGKDMFEAAKKKNIYVGENRQASNFADVFNFPKTTKDGQIFYDINKLNNEKAVDTILKAQVRSGSATDYAKKKFPVKTVYEHTKKRVDKIVEEGGWGKNDPWAGKRGSGVQLGHGDDFWAGRRITPQSLLYTPSEINKLMGDKGMLDDKIHAVYEKQEYGKLTKKGDELKKFLNETDATLTRLADQSDGFKQVTLSNNKSYGGQRLSVDMFDEFKGKSQKEAIDFVNKWKDKKIITEGPNKTPAKEIEKIKKANFFEINRKNAYDAALKMSQKEKTKIMSKIKGEALQKLKDAGIPCIKGVGGQCNSIADYQKGYNKLVQEGAEGSAKAIQKLGRFTKAMRGITGAAKWTGYGLLAEVGFMVPFAIGDYSAGESWKRILGNATDYGFGPILGQSEQEEFEAALPEGSAAPQRRKVYELGERLYNLENQKVNPGYGRPGFRQRAEPSRQKVYDSILDEYILNMQPFMRTSPHLEESRFYDQYLMDKAEQEDIATMEKLEAERQARIDERTERGIIADQNWQSQIAPRYAQGGIASLKRK